MISPSSDREALAPVSQPSYWPIVTLADTPFQNRCRTGRGPQDHPSHLARPPQHRRYGTI